jgi:hypothetical protein
MSRHPAMSVWIVLTGISIGLAEAPDTQPSGQPAVWVASDANKVNPISGNVLEEHYWHRSGREGFGYDAAPSYQKGPRSGTLQEKSAVWDAASRRVRLRAAGNEFVSFQVIVEKADQPLKAVRVAVSDLGGPGGATIRSSRDIEVFVEHYIGLFTNAKDPWNLASYYGEKRWFPDGLIPVAAKGWGKADLPEPRLNVDGQTVQAAL